MPTTDDLRTAMNDLAGGTDALSSAAVLRAGKRHRTRRRLVGGAGAAATVLAVVAVVAVLPWRQGGDRSAPIATATSAAVSASPSAPALTRAERFVPGPERETERGVFTTEITDRQLPAGEDFAATVDLIRIPGVSTLPEPVVDAGDRVYVITVAGTKVHVLEDPVTVGVDRQYEWIAGDTHWVLAANAYSTATDEIYGPSEDDLRWLIERALKR